MAAVADLANLSIDPVLAVITFATDDHVSAPVFIGGATLIGIELPVLEGTECSFLVSLDASTFQPLKDSEGTLITITFAAGSSSHPLNANDFVGWTDIKVKTTTAQLANRTIKLVPRAI